MIFLLVYFWLFSGFAQTDLRAMARQELQRQNHPVDTKKSPKKRSTETTPSETGAPPTIMLPLHDPYKPVSLRSWQWSFDVGLTSEKIPVVRQDFLVGRQDLKDLGNLSFLKLNFGFEKQQSWGGWGASLIGAGTTKSGDVNAASGRIKANLQYISYGIQPHISKKWTPYFGTTLGLQYELISVAQTSVESDFARWSEGYTSSNVRLGFDGYISETQAVTLSYFDKNSVFGRGQALGLSYGVKW